MKSKATPATNNDDQTTMNGAVAGYPSKTSLSTNESPPGAGPTAHRRSGGAVLLNYSRGAAARDAYADRHRHFTTVVGDTRTKQSFKDECDINTIMARYMRTGIMEHTRQSVAQYLDVTGADFQEAQNLIAGARSMFYELPANIRERFDNQPAELLAFLEKPENREEAVKLGLLNAKAPLATPLHTPPASAAPAAPTQAPGASATPGAPQPPTPGPGIPAS